MNQRHETTAAIRPSRATFLRRRIAVTGTLLLAIIAAATMLSGQAKATDANSPKTAFTYVTVHSGDDLWALADRYAGQSDHRDWVANLVSLNALQSDTLQPGQRLALPNH